MILYQTPKVIHQRVWLHSSCAESSGNPEIERQVEELCEKKLQDIFPSLIEKFMLTLKEEEAAMRTRYLHEQKQLQQQQQEQQEQQQQQQSQQFLDQPAELKVTEFGSL